jgi:hypothetical protein
MSGSAKCPHTTVAIDAQLTAMSDSNLRSMQLAVKCSACGCQMLFLGAPMGVSLQRPTRSVDSSMLYVPMYPEDEEPAVGPEIIARRVK